MNVIFKTMALLIALLIMLSLSALADRTRYLDPSPSEEVRLREIAADFFSVKTGISRDELLKCKMLIRFMEGDVKTMWEILVYSIYGQGFYASAAGPEVWKLLLHPDFTLYSWNINCPFPFYEAEPDLMSMGTVITPTDADASPQDIYEQAMAHLKNDHHVVNPERYTYQVALIVEEHYSNYLPVWVVYVRDGKELLWKGLFGYTGTYMTLVPARQDYMTYSYIDYRFMPYADVKRGYYEPFEPGHAPVMTRELIYRVQRRKADREEAIRTLQLLVPMYRQWKQTHLRGDPEMEGFIDEFGWMLDTVE